MSHSVTIRTHQTVTSSSTAIIINSGYLKTWSGILKLVQVALGAVCVGIAADHITNHSRYNFFTTEMFFLLITTTFMIGTFLLLMSCLISLSTSSIMAKTMHEVLYHSIAFGLYLSAALTYMIRLSDYKGYSEYGLLLGAAICGLVNAALYLFSTIIAVRTYKGF
ncbi:uncharacterized protein LOC108632063 [Ceratina calcarata]|uniref:Uncharacterized protein LOC108632063 n=1 Tax=Ceratina calcarata TaxID=156304 RepID=A0AAJ7SDJ8_9HYME|nr:uncharacterized protein LOC108632063 [Ceratina calcarata]XP_026675172.1 uncharacterized protein LOC108632063 [Ceratina calcarata]